MSDLLDEDAFASWFTVLFPTHSYGWIVGVSAGVGVCVFGVGYVVAAAGGVAYLVDSVPFFGAFGVAWTLAWLGWADGAYVDVWNEVRPAFAVDDETYLEVVRPRLERAFDERRILAYGAALGVPYYVVTAVYFLPGMPFHDAVSALVLSKGYVPLSGGLTRVGYYYLVGTAVFGVFATVLNGFVVHLELVGAVSELPFRDVYASATELEPVARFTMESATAWFAGVSVVVAFVGTGISPHLGTAVIAPLVLAGAVFFVAPQVVLHAALSDAKREELAAIRTEYESMSQAVRGDAEPAELLSLRLDVTDRRLESAKSIRTWAYDISSAGRLAAASVLPWFDLFRAVLEGPFFG